MWHIGPGADAGLLQLAILGKASHQPIFPPTCLDPHCPPLHTCHTPFCPMLPTRRVVPAIRRAGVWLGWIYEGSGRSVALVVGTHSLYNAGVLLLGLARQIGIIGI